MVLLLAELQYMLGGLLYSLKKDDSFEKMISNSPVDGAIHTEKVGEIW
jgi:hypothetical protein